MAPSKQAVILVVAVVITGFFTLRRENVGAVEKREQVQVDTIALHGGAFVMGSNLTAYTSDGETPPRLVRRIKNSTTTLD